MSGGYQFRTRTQFSAWVQQLIAGRPVRLSRAQLETLAIIAYRQPITRPEIDDIRGVDSSATARRDLIRRAARWLETCGVRVPRNSAGEPADPLEISPAYALDAEDLRRRMQQLPALTPGRPLLLW